MIKLLGEGRYYVKGELISEEQAVANGFSNEQLKEGYKGTIAYGIIDSHNTIKTEKGKPIKLKFDCLASHDITYVGIVQTAKASGLEHFPIPYVLTNCHNSLCAVGGTINEDDHVFGLSAAKKYGGIFVPPHLAVIHTFMREYMSGCGKMILGSDSHTRYGALGCMGVGEGGPELVKQLLERTYDINYPDVVAVRLTGKPSHGIGPQDVALAIIGAVFAKGFVKNKIVEFIGDGIANLPIEYRNGIDVMTTETTCISSVWCTDDIVKEYYKEHGRADGYKKLEPKEGAYYDAVVDVNLSEIKAQIAMPFHPSNVYNLSDVIANPYDILNEVEQNCQKLIGSKVPFKLTNKIKDGKLMIDQGIIAGCAGGTYDNIAIAGNILSKGVKENNDFTLSVYPSSQPIYSELMKNGSLSSIIEAGGIVKTAFCGPCFGAGDVPSHNALSIRHTTRNFESREGSKMAQGQISSVALMDARSIAATALNGGVLTSAESIDYKESIPKFKFNPSIYEKRVYNGSDGKDKNSELVYGPNIADWPTMIALTDNIIMEVAAAITDPVTTTDELIPSGETSSYRSNPLRLAEFTLSRKCPDYVEKAKVIKGYETLRRDKGELPQKYQQAIDLIGGIEGSVSIGSTVASVKPGDGSAREQAASCQRVLGGISNICQEYATKRYRSNLINWGMIPFLSEDKFENGDIIIVPKVREGVASYNGQYSAKLVRNNKAYDITLKMDALTPDETEIILKGCLINYYKN